MDIERYKRVFSFDIPYNKFAEEVTIVPSEEDYNDESITRYFVKKINDFRIIEVDRPQYNNLNDDIYQKVSLLWYISGPKRSIIKNGVEQVKGVYEKNMNSIKKANSYMIGIENKLINPLQFHKD